MELSINQFAKEVLGTDPRTVRRIIARLKAENPNLSIGTNLGEGKATMLSVSDMELIRSHYTPKSTSDKLSDKPNDITPDSAAIVPILETDAIAVSRGSALEGYQAPDIPVLQTFKHQHTADFVTNTLANIDQLLQVSAEQDENIDAELMRQSAERGAKRGAILAQVEIAATEAARRTAVNSMAKKQGLEENLDRAS